MTSTDQAPSPSEQQVQEQERFVERLRARHARRRPRPKRDAALLLALGVYVLSINWNAVTFWRQAPTPETLEGWVGRLAWPLVLCAYFTWLVVFVARLAFGETFDIDGEKLDEASAELEEMKRRFYATPYPERHRDE